MSALLGTFVKLSTMADGTPRIVMDLQCTLADVAALGLMPGVAFGIARINGEASCRPAEPRVDATSAPILAPKTGELSTPKTPAGPLCIMAATFCKTPLFWKWLEVETEEEAKQVILHDCHITSRKELDINNSAGGLFLSNVRAPYVAWRALQ